jgi:translocation and assembly module TamA
MGLCYFSIETVEAAWPLAWTKPSIQIQGPTLEFVQEHQLLETAEEAFKQQQKAKVLDDNQVFAYLIADRLQNSLRSQGFFLAQVYGKPIEDKEKIVGVQLKVDSGVRYKIQKQTLVWSKPPKYLKELDQLEWPDIEYAQSQTLIKQAQKIEATLVNAGCFMQVSVKPNAILDHAQQEALIEYQIDYQDEARFGPTRFSGTTQVRHATLKNMLTYQENECFKKNKLETTNANLLKTQLFSSIHIKTPETPDQSGFAPIEIELSQRATKTVGLGINYDFDEDLSLSANWANRNVKNKARELSFKSNLSTYAQNLDSQYKIPFFRRNNQSLTFKSNIQTEDRVFYQADQMSLLAEIGRPWKYKSQYSYGAGLRFSQVQENQKSVEDFTFLLATTLLSWDSRNDLIDPTHGQVLKIAFTPYYDLSSRDAGFLRLDLVGQYYHSWLDLPGRPTLAFRSIYGQMTGSLFNIPNDLLYFSGGGGSVRGYSYQSIGPRVADIPTGGNLLFEFSTEARFRFTDYWGGAVFLETGQVEFSSDPMSLFKETFPAIGFGARYFSPIGPFRVDLGFPLKDIQQASNYGIYISLGQAF